MLGQVAVGTGRSLCVCLQSQQTAEGCRGGGYRWHVVGAAALPERLRLSLKSTENL